MAALLAPHAEVVLHDLATGRVSGIWNRFSTRAVGDESLLDVTPESLREPVQILGPYTKREADGRMLKSVTIVLRSPKSGKPTALLCINLDLSMFESAMQFISGFLTVENPRPDVLFARDWREQANLLVHEWLDQNNLSKAALGRREKIALVRFLDGHSLFETRKAVEHLAGLLGVSRATVYNYLSAAREHDAQENAA